MADENVPHGISEKQDEIIQYVAKYVVSSCDGARYQEKIRTRTKYNSYFAFLNAKHPYHHYYQYLLDSYRYYLLNSEAINAGGWGGAVDGSGAHAQQHPQQQLTEEEYYQYYGAYQSQTGGIGFQTGEGDGSVYGHTSYPHEAAPVEGASNGNSGSHTTTTTGGDAWGNASAGVVMAAEGSDPTAVNENADGTAGQGDATEVDGKEEEDEEEEYELVMENGEWVSRKRS